MTTYLPLFAELTGLVIASLLFAYLTRHQTQSNSLFERDLARMQRKARKHRKPTSREPLPHSLLTQSDPEPEPNR